MPKKTGKRKMKGKGFFDFIKKIGDTVSGIHTKLKEFKPGTKALEFGPGLKNVPYVGAALGFGKDKLGYGKRRRKK